MELQLTTAQNQWREEVRDFLDTELPPQWEKSTEWCEDEDFWDFAVAFTRKVSARGWIGLTWPKEYGGLGRPPIDQLIYSEEFTYRDAPVVNAIGWGLAAGALLRGGTQAQKQKFLPPIQRTDVLWAEGYTEPEAGSDLASLTTRAVRDGDEWVISGQKTFTTWGTHADVLYCAARTDPEAPRHRGITIFGLPIHQPGVSFGPLLNIGGGRQNHTFLDGARVPHENMIGQEGRGWDLIMGGFYGGNIGAAYMDAQQKLDMIVAYCKTARRNGKLLIDDAVVRDQLAEMDLLVQAERRPGSGPRSATTRAAPRRSSGWCWPPADSASRDRTRTRPWTSISSSIKPISPTRRAASSKPAARSARSAAGRPPSQDSPLTFGRRWPTSAGSGSAIRSPWAASAAAPESSASSTRPWAAPWRPSRIWSRR
jgi:alkylation response protein AidB-like acyl-CoA dehydrogenase